MITMLGNIVAEVLTILALSTNEMQERRTKRYMKRLVGRTGVKDALQRPDKLTQEETRMTVTKNLQVTHNILECAQHATNSSRVKTGVEAARGREDEVEERELH